MSKADITVGVISCLREAAVPFGCAECHKGYRASYTLTNIHVTQHQTYMLNLTPHTNQSDPEHPSTEPTPVVDGSAYGFDTLGAMLRERREAVGISLAEVEVATRIRQKYLSAIEADDWHLLPGEIVGRGFLRNYATYLGLEPNELVERRRAVVDPRLAASLTGTSAGAPLPPERQVDYRPKDVDLRDEPDGIEDRDRNITPALVVLLAFALAFMGWWFINRLGSATGSVVSGAQTRVATLFEPRATTSLIDGAQSDAAIATGDGSADNGSADNGSADNGSADDSGDAGDSGANNEGATSPAAGAAPEAEGGENVPAATAPPADTPTPEPPPIDTPTPEPPPADTPTPEPPPADTPTPLPPTNTPIPPPPPTATPLPPPPTNTPAPPPPPAVVAPSCPDPRSVITSPGANQIVGGVIDIVGTATHESFQNYKLEFAVGGMDAGNNNAGWNWFAGTSAAVQGGRLGQLDTSGLANGTYTIRVVTVDLTANFPPPCGVTINVQN